MTLNTLIGLLKLPQFCIYWSKRRTVNLHCLLGITAQMTGMKCGGVCEDAEVVFRPFQDSL